jgi:hypothetical protein
MAKLSRLETERRMRIMAKAKTDMLLGVYIWPDERESIDKQGLPVVSNREILRKGGYSSNYKSPSKTIFADPYFEEQCRLEMERRMRFDERVTAFSPALLDTVIDGALNELDTRLRNDPTAFTKAELMRLVEHFVPLRAQSKLPEKSNTRIDQLNAFLGSQVSVMTPPERERLVETSAKAADERTRDLQRLIDAATIVEEDADDLAVIDAEVCPEPA